MKCQNCGHDPAEPVYVGPGDHVMIEGKQWRCVADLKEFTDHGGVMFERADKWTHYSGMAFDDGVVTTLDGRPVAGYRDPRDERIKELEALNDKWSTEDSEALTDARVNIKHQSRVIVKLREQLKSANPLAGLTDEQIASVIRHYVEKPGIFMPWTQMLRDIRDNKLEVPK